MKARHIIFAVILAGIIIGVLFILPAGGFIGPPTMVCDLRLDSKFFYVAMLFGSSIKETTCTATNWRETNILGLTIGEALLHGIYGANPLQILGLFETTYHFRWELVNLESGKTWVKTISVTISWLSLTYAFGMTMTFNKCPAGTYQLNLFSPDLSFNIYGTEVTWDFELAEGKMGTIWQTSGGPLGEWLVKP